MKSSQQRTIVMYYCFMLLHNMYSTEYLDYNIISLFIYTHEMFVLSAERDVWKSVL